MKNLKVIQAVKADFGADIIGHCIDADNRRLFVVAEDLSVYDISGSKPSKIEHNLNLTAIINNVKYDEVVLIEYIVETGCIIIAFKCGSVIKLAVSSFGQQSGRIYEHGCKIASLRLSPSQDLVALADENNHVHLLTPDLEDCLHKYDALKHNDSLHKPVGVGWGSKETQFFGLDGRPSKEKEDKNKPNLDEYELEMIDKIENSQLFHRFCTDKELSTVVDWRGDGQLLITLTYIPDNGRHYLKVWNRNLELQYMSEQLVDIKRGLVCWIPNGQYVCCVQRREKCINELALFERNGMVHQRITLPAQLKHLYIKELAWSSDSSILAIIAIQFSVSEGEVQKRHLLLLYTMQNFQHYLKYTTEIGTIYDDADTIYWPRWNPTNTSILYVWSSKGQCFEFDCTAIVNYESEGSLVAVQDANKILLTPLNICNVPPPMAAIELEFPQMISKILIDSQSHHLMHILTLGDILYFPADGESEFDISVRINTPEVVDYAKRFQRYCSVELRDASKLQNLTVIDKNNLVTSKQTIEYSELVLLTIQSSASGYTLTEDVLHRIPAPAKIVSIIRKPKHAHEDSPSIYFITDDWKCAELRASDKRVTQRFQLQTLNNDKAQLLDAQFIGFAQSEESRLVTLSLDLTLRIDDDILVSNSCSSFRCTENFLIYTTTDNILHIEPIKKICNKNDQQTFDCWTQPIENGGVLVIATELDSKVVLQMPRGNLEILHPRILVLLEILKHMIAENFVIAMKLARRHRVDSNFICDFILKRTSIEHLPSRLSIFTNQISNHDPSLLNIFISELNDEDTIRGRYKEAMNSILSLYDEPIIQNIPIDDKVNLVCRSFAWTASEKCCQARLLSLLRQKPSRADEAIKIIYSMDSEVRSELLRFMLYFVSIDQLFNDALSTYNIDIALMVAGVSNKDPKEYLALLDSFNEIQERNLRNYTIDLHIKNYPKAFEHAIYHIDSKLSQNLDNHDSISDEITKFRVSVQNLVYEKRIFKEAIRFCLEFESQSRNVAGFSTVFNDLSREIWMKYANYLLEKRYYLEAGLVYIDCGKYIQNDTMRYGIIENALKCFKLIDEVEIAFALIQSNIDCEERRETMLQSLFDYLMLRGKTTEAALVGNARRSADLAQAMLSKSRWFLAQALLPKSSSSLHSFTESCAKEFQEELQSEVCDEIDRALGAAREDVKSAQAHFERLKELVTTSQPVGQRVVDSDGCLIADSLSTIDGSEATSIISGSALGAHKALGKQARSGAPSVRTRASSSSSSKSKKSSADQKKKVQLKRGSRYEDMAIALELKKFVNKQKLLQEQTRQLEAAQIYFAKCLYPNSEPMSELRATASKSYELAKEICMHFWPRGIEAQAETVHSLYKRFIRRLESEELLENVDFEILISPDLPKSCNLLEL